METTAAKVRTENLNRDGRGGKKWRVTDRDRLLVGHLATVRYLTREQVWRLAFPKRAESVVSERLRGLEQLGLLRRLRCRRYAGEALEIWALTLAGYRVAEDVIGPLQRIPAHDVGDDFFEHHVGLVELYLAVLGAGVECLGPRRRRAALAAAARGRRPSSSESPTPLPAKWSWVSGDQLQRLHLSRKTRRDEPVQVLLPDAVAEFPLSAAGPRRMFLEWETGSNPLAAGEKRNSLVTKLARYDRFLTSYVEHLNGPTWYAKAFPDKWPVRVRFVMHSERRKKNAAEVLSKWREGASPKSRELDFRVVTVGEVVSEMRARFPFAKNARQPPPPPVEVTLSKAELRSFSSLYNATLMALELPMRDVTLESLRTAATEAHPVLVRLQNAFHKSL